MVILLSLGMIGRALNRGMYGSVVGRVVVGRRLCAMVETQASSTSYVKHEPVGSREGIISDYGFW